MSLHDLIFSDDRRYRVLRHLSFWIGWFLFSSMAQVSNFNNSFDTDPVSNIGNIVIFQLNRTLSRLSGIIIFSYFIVYYLAPRFLQRGRFITFGFLFLISGLLLYLVTLGSLYFWLQVAKTNPFIHPWPVRMYLFNSFYSNINFTGAIPACCLMLAVKYYKNWYIKQRRSEELTRENRQAELQLLKAQIHPHFLFNTLNNIYSFVLTGDHRAAGLVDKLAGMINYMRNEGENTLVPLESEIRLIKDYTGLEKVRYGDRLDLHLDVKGDYHGKMIAPLLMIPFVENCFKHGPSMMRGNQWIHLSIDIKDDQLDFHLSNSKPGSQDNHRQKGKRTIGLMNVRKRLQLLYPENHTLQINSAEDVFEVHLLLTMQEITSVQINQQTVKESVYA